MTEISKKRINELAYQVLQVKIMEEETPSDLSSMIQHSIRVGSKKIGIEKSEFALFVKKFYSKIFNQIFKKLDDISEKTDVSVERLNEIAMIITRAQIGKEGGLSLPINYLKIKIMVKSGAKKLGISKKETAVFIKMMYCDLYEKLRIEIDKFIK